ncbi:winged helix-turn-helix transcriptional regulator [Streptomyces sp. NBC_01445]|uniref:winged helix-turn-helix transcriptional regulator n=1 Tax=Streptomyces sp. NBC_01445 TaxID=2903869 RepID=UPI003FA352E4
MSRRMLTLVLKRLQCSGLVERTAYAEVPPCVEYSTHSLGASLLSAIEHLAAWSSEHHTGIRRHQDAYDKSATQCVTGMSNRSSFVCSFP